VEGYCEHGNENAGNFLSSCTVGGFSSRTQLHEVSFNNIWQGAQTMKLLVMQIPVPSCHAIPHMSTLQHSSQFVRIRTQSDATSFLE
jgi:hypothetical protein